MSTETAAEIFVDSFPVGPLQCNCTIVGDPAAGEAIVIDPGGDTDIILDHLNDAGLHKVTRIIHTHAHFDHFLAAGFLREKTNAPLGVHRGDEYLWTHLEEQCARYAIPYQPVPPPDQWLQHEEELCAACVKGQAIHTPGHTPGSMSFWFEDANLLVAGDTLFKNGVGRTDLWGGDYDAMEKSIKKRLYTLDEEATVITGHGPSTTIGHEKRANPYVRA